MKSKNVSKKRKLDDGTLEKVSKDNLVPTKKARKPTSQETSKTSNTSNAAQLMFPWLSLPIDILANIVSFLPFENILKIASTCENFNAAAKEKLLWMKVAEDNDIVLNFLKNTDEPFNIKDNVLMKLQEILSVKKLYPKEMIDAMGGAAKLTSCPVLELDKIAGYDGFFDYIDFVRPSDVKGAKIWRGVDKWERPFVIVCAKISDEKPNVETLFREMFDVNELPFYISDFEFDNCWASDISDGSTKFINAGHDYKIKTYSYERLARLVRGEKVGCLDGNGAEGPKETKEGRSVIRLTDQMSDDESDDRSEGRNRARVV